MVGGKWCAWCWFVLTFSCVVTGCQGVADVANADPVLELEPGDPERTYQVGDTVEITLFATDRDGDPVSFSFAPISPNELNTLSNHQLFPGENSATFRWVPDSADITTPEAPHRLIFEVIDGRGGEAQRELRVHINPGNGAPRFTSPTSQNYAECCDEAFVYEVVVQDDNSTQVELVMESGPPGAEFIQVNGKRGRFEWRPEARPERTTRARFLARDESDLSAQMELVIVVQPERDREEEAQAVAALGEGSCPTSMLLEHEPPGPQRVSTRGFDIELGLGDTRGYEEVFVFPSWIAPGDPAQLVEFYEEPILMQVSEGVARAQIPNYALDVNKNIQILYEFCLFDTDGVLETLCEPDSFQLYYSFDVLIDPQTICMDDLLDATARVDDDTALGARRDLDLRDEWYLYQACPQDPDFHAITVRPGQKLKVVVAHGHALDASAITLLDADQVDVTDGVASFSCGLDYSLIEIAGEIGEEAQLFYLVIDSDVPSNYFINSHQLDAGRECLDRVIESNDTFEQATELRVGERRGGYELCPDERDVDVFAVELVDGQRLDVVMRADSSAAQQRVSLYSPRDAEKIRFDTQREEADAIDIMRADGVGFSFEARECGTHYVVVDSTLGGVEYSLESAISEAFCQDDDELGPCNHKPSTAKPAVFSLVDQMKVCPQSEDWYKIYGQFLRQTWRLEALGGGDLAFTTFELLDEGGEVLASGQVKAVGEKDVLELTYDFSDNDVYLIRVANIGFTNFEYNVTVVDDVPL